MAPKQNPLRLNKLQLKTLTLFQELARAPETSTAREDGSILITSIPRPHGNHFHLGAGVVMAADATGLQNESVWRALERKALINRRFPIGLVLTPAGKDYETNMRSQILHIADH